MSQSKGDNMTDLDREEVRKALESYDRLMAKVDARQPGASDIVGRTRTFRGSWLWWLPTYGTERKEQND